MQMLIVGEEPDEIKYFSLGLASKLITQNQWGIPVDGIHSETLRRAYRDHPEHGVHIGRDVFFTVKNLEQLSYRVDENKYHIPDEFVVRLNGRELVRK